MNSAVAVALPVVSQPTDTFRCEHYKCTLTARACALRQGAEAKSAFGRDLVDTAPSGRSARFNDHCTSGDCAQGAAIKRQLRGQQIDPPRPIDWRAQHAAKRRQAGGGEAKAERRTPPAPAAPPPPPIPTAPAAPAPKEAAMPKKSKLSETTDTDFRDAYATASAKELMKRFACGYDTLRARADKLGLAPRAQGAPRTARPDRVAPPPASADEFERMRRIIDDYQALSREGRLYVSGRLSSLSGA